MGRTHISTLRVFFAVLVLGLVTVAPAASAPTTPTTTGPADGAEVTFLPAFAWERAAGADHYEFQLSADVGFNSLTYSVSTKNTRATPDKTVPNGEYFWRVRSVDPTGGVSGWSPFSTIVKLWAEDPTLSSPDDGEVITYPAEPLVLRWAAVQGAAKYRVFISQSPSLSAPYVNGANPYEVQALNLAPNVLLPQNTYYWAVTPLDAQGNPGEQSEVRSFTWTWPSTTTPLLEDLNDTTELFDPQFSWEAVPGAARYEVEVNSDLNFDPASKVCCTDKAIATTLSPLEVFANNTYYWRVRAIDRDGNAGVWNEGDPFVKTFDNYPDLSELSIKRLRMFNATDPDLDLTGVSSYSTDDPIVVWDAVPGASSYEVDVVPYDTAEAPGRCDWTVSVFQRWTGPTATTAWTPLSGSKAPTAPYPVPTGMTVSKDFRGLTPGESYCARVRARSGRVTLSTAIWGDHTYIGNGEDEPSFTFTNFPAGDLCQGCYAGYLGTDDYSLPIRGETKGANPLFTWKPITGKLAYWVIVSKDPSFTTIVDYAITNIPAYAVRTGSQPRTYSDEETSYYWVVLPSNFLDGAGAPGNPAFGAYADFQKQTAQPDLLEPSEGATFAGQPTFRWTSIFGARRYHLQVDDETSFSTPIDDVRTSGTTYTSLKSYNSAQTFYWRVAPEDENNTALTWSPTGSFEVDLPAPTMDQADFGTGDFLPVVSWSAVQGAVEYELQVQEADGDHKEYDGFPSTAASWEKMSGVGILTLRIRALFPTASTFTRVSGPWSSPATFTHTITEPNNPASDAGVNKLVLSWNAKTGTKQYKVQVSSRADFNPFIESKSTDNPTFAPTLNSSSYAGGGSFLWRVAAVDSDGNVGDWATRTFDLPPITTAPASLKVFAVSSSGRLVSRRLRTVYVTVRDQANSAAVLGASVRASGPGVLVTKFTNTSGVAKFSLKPTKTGYVYFRVSKSGFATKTFKKRIYRP